MPARHTHGGGFLPIPTSPPVLTGWFPLPIGMGGYVTGVRIANDGSLVHWTDVNMGFVFNPGTNKWKQLYTLTGFPKSCVEASLVAGNNGQPFAQGAYAVEIAPSNSNTIYVVGPFSKDGSMNTLFSAL